MIVATDDAARAFIQRGKPVTASPFLHKVTSKASARPLHVHVRRIVRDLGLIDADIGKADADGDGDDGNDPFGHGNLRLFQMEIVQTIATDNVNAVTEAK